MATSAPTIVDKAANHAATFDISHCPHPNGTQPLSSMQPIICISACEELLGELAMMIGSAASCQALPSCVPASRRVVEIRDWETCRIKARYESSTPAGSHRPKVTSRSSHGEEAKDESSHEKNS